MLQIKIGINYILKLIVTYLPTTLPDWKAYFRSLGWSEVVRKLEAEAEFQGCTPLSHSGQSRPQGFFRGRH